MNKSDLYHEALNLHRHYDNLSQLSIASIVALSGATPVAYDKIKDLTFGGSIFFGGAILIWIVFQLYDRFDAHAAMCMKFAELIEQSGPESSQLIVKTKGEDLKPIHGVAYAFHHRKEFKSLDLRGGGFIFRRIRIICFLCIIAFTMAGAFLTFEGWKEKAKKPEVGYLIFRINNLN